MPPLPPDDSDAGHGDGDRIDDPVEFRPPLPPEDRIWRHPSEVAAGARGRGSDGRASTSRRGTVAMVAVSILIGATLSIGVVAAVGGFDPETRVVERQVAVQPLTSSRDESSIAAITERTGPSVAGVYVTRDGEQNSGSATVFRSDGYLLTTAELLRDAERVEIRLHDGSIVPAEVVGTDPHTDLAVLRVDADVSPAPLGSASGLQPGDEIVALSYAVGGRWTTTVDRAVVAALDRRLRTPAGEVLHGMILIDAPLSVSAAGGPLLDRTGAVVGVASGVPAGDDATTYGVATPIDVAVHACDQMIEYGRVRHVWLGVEGVDLDPKNASAMGLDGGAAIEDVIEDSPAEIAGIQPGDVVIGVGDETVMSMSELIAALRTGEPGEEVHLVVRRGDETVELWAVLAERDPE